MTKLTYPQIKVCGLTQPDEAKACAELGADAIGLVFYARSPRNVTIEQAAAVKAVLPASVAAVGVFVDPELDTLLNIVAHSGLDAIQLHGAESPGFVTQLRRETDAKIIKVLFSNRAPAMNDARDYAANSYLVECGGGPLPGGNAMTWDWGAAKSFALDHPLILAGGLGPHTVADAIAACLPDAVDASSALESQPGRKDLAKVEEFIKSIQRSAVHYAAKERRLRPIFSTRITAP